MKHGLGKNRLGKNGLVIGGAVVAVVLAVNVDVLPPAEAP